jgi:Holliday junction resolvase RusA-like endonuclease
MPTYRSFTLRNFKVLPKHDGEGVQRRASATGRVNIHGYRVPKKARNQDEITLLAAAYAPRKPWTGPIRLDMHATFKLPEKWAEVGADRLRDLPHFERAPDRMNLLKQVEDALEGAFYENDRQVCCGQVSKAWGDEFSVRIWVGQITPDAFAKCVAEGRGRRA